jgi:hypothetical protein
VPNNMVLAKTIETFNPDEDKRKCVDLHHSAPGRRGPGAGGVREVTRERLATAVMACDSGLRYSNSICQTVGL